MGVYGYGVVDTEHPAIVNAINNMINSGYSKEKIVQITGAPPEVVDSHMIRHERGQKKKPGRPKGWRKKAD